MLPRMASRRTPVRIEFITADGICLEMDHDGWRLLRTRALGQKMLERARAILEKVEECRPPEDPDRLVPPDLLEIAEFVAKKHNLRITHRYFRQH